MKNSEQAPEEQKKLLSEDKSIVIDINTPVDQKQSEEIQTERAQLPPKHAKLRELDAELS